MVAYRDNRNFVMADIPGIIEGAHEGAGLGQQFLRHVERCKVLVHLVDCSAEGDDRSPSKDLKTLDRELELYDAELAKKPQIIAANKADLPEAKKKAQALKRRLATKGQKVHIISAATGEGLKELLDAIAKELWPS